MVFLHRVTSSSQAQWIISDWVSMILTKILMTYKLEDFTIQNGRNRLAVIVIEVIDDVLSVVILFQIFRCVIWFCH